jgi:FkbM family methyltransferase
VELELRGAADGRLRLGRIVELHWSDDDEVTELRLLARHGPLLYLKPIVDWTRDRVISFFPESPGRYVLVAQWRGHGTSLQCELPLEVESSCSLRPGPTRADLDATTSLWTPSEWDARVLAASEHTMLAALQALVQPGDAVYDIGANMGLYAIRLAQRVGRTGRVYCVEASPVCVSYLQANVALHALDNVEILPVAVLDRVGETEFAIHYGNVSIGLTAASPFYRQKLGHEIRVRCAPLDELIREHALRPPRVIKMDIEGAEASALRGMRRTLEAERPTLILELHGAWNAQASLDQLDPLGYRYLDPASGARFHAAKEVVDALGDVVCQIVAQPAA